MSTTTLQLVPWPPEPARAAVLLVAAVVCLWVLLSRRRAAGGSKDKERAARLPPGSFGWPLVGETLDFVSCAYSSRPEAFVDKRRLLHGSAVFRSHLFGSATVVTSDAEVSRFVLHSDARAFVPWYPRSLTELMGESSILLINGSLQRRVHGLVGAFFKSPQLKAQVTADMQRRLAPALAAWKVRCASAPPLRIQDHAKTIVFEILVRGLIGLEAGPEMQQLKHQFQEFIVGLMSLPIKLPGTRLYRSLQAKKRMATLIQGIIQEKRRRRRAALEDGGEGEGEAGPPRDVIDVLISGGDELTDELISDNMIDLMIPAEDSVPVLITLAVKYLSECPLALQQLEEENMQLKRRKTDVGETLQWTDYMSLSFTQHVITETLRMGNIINGIMRKAVRDVEVKGHLIPKGWCVFVYFRSVHLDDKRYDEPYRFNPWRWKEKDTSTMGFTPFGGGQRLCPGLDLARLEASIFLHHLVTSFRWVAEEDHIVNFPTVRLKRGMPVRLTSKD
ncbi:putative cytochrome P450 superfamily protein [Zea mays]|uniref:Cytochrome P450 90D2 n=1 Tax=Zea mays TaxID=4577 RepID=C4IZQ0_MAIZE|nr:putative cytochrome P450 superfamily protein [Zea mays]ACR34400.1 unknown [Zea mays]ONM28888.1 3-epi-6-deoxocathasterone 23-monooxygenase [Zea mays]|eukprot:NP_001170664.1 putative cytochrome P450 superfamily protein [Zea mays]